MQRDICGYIVQQLDEELLMPPMGAKRLFLSYKEALEHAKALYESYLEQFTNGADELLYEVYNPTKEHIDISGGVLIFRSRDFQVWIDLILR